MRMRDSKPGKPTPSPLPGQVYRHADGYNVLVTEVTSEASGTSVRLEGYENTNPRTLARFTDEIYTRGEWRPRFTFLAENVTLEAFSAQYV